MVIKALSFLTILASAAAAQAATLNVVGGNAGVLPPSYSLKSVASVGDATTVFEAGDKTAMNGLFLDEAADLKFTFLGSEAGFSNVFVVNGADVFSNKANAVGDMFVSANASAGFVGFSFVSRGIDTLDNAGLISSGTRLAFKAISGGSVLAFLDDRTTDVDFDDLVVRIDIVPTPVPIPASGWIFAAALGGMGLLYRSRRNLV